MSALENLLTQGDQAPSFSTVNQNDDTVTLDQFSGKTIVLYFYPKALTPGCTTQACGLRDNKAELDALNAIALGISPDEPKKLTRFIEKHDLNFDLLSDVDHKIADQFGVWGLKKFMGKEYDGIHRITFIIGGDGIIKEVMTKFKTKSHHDDVLDVLRKL
jgi:thioredoxin-dependent peroxiredoxin